MNCWDYTQLSVSNVKNSLAQSIAIATNVIADNILSSASDRAGRSRRVSAGRVPLRKDHSTG
jgi:hypothetical protein